MAESSRRSERNEGVSTNAEPPELAATECAKNSGCASASKRYHKHKLDSMPTSPSLPRAAAAAAAAARLLALQLLAQLPARRQRLLGGHGYFISLFYLFVCLFVFYVFVYIAIAGRARGALQGGRARFRRGSAACLKLPL